MAKPKYPLMCATARGILGKRLVYREIKGTPVVSIFRPAIDRKTPAQLASRQKFRDIAAAWNTHTQEERDTLKPYVEGKNLTTYDYYTKKYIETGEDPLGPAPGPQNLMATTITNLHLPFIVGTPAATIHFVFLWITWPNFFAGITDPNNVYEFFASAPEKENIIILIRCDWPGSYIPAGYIIEVSTDIISDLPVYLPEVLPETTVPVWPDIDGSTYYDPGLTQLAQAAP